MDYGDYIPELPPREALDWLRETDGDLRTETAVFKKVSRPEAEAWSESDEVLGSLAPAGTEETQYALVWCSGCGGYYFAQWKAEEKGRRSHGAFRGEARRAIVLEDPLEDRLVTVESGMLHRCPCCGSAARFYHAAEARYGGIPRGGWVGVPQLINGTPVIVWYYHERRDGFGTYSESTRPAFAYAFEKKKIVHLRRMREMFGQVVWENEWRVVKRYYDEAGRAGTVWPGARPCLDGTALENAKLWELWSEAGANLRPVSYIRLWMKHPNAENLVTCGLGKMLAEAIDREQPAPRLEWIDWKAVRPAQMLHMTKDQLRCARAAKWSAAQYETWAELSEAGVPFDDALYAFGALHEYEVRLVARELGTPLRKTAAYLTKQRASAATLADYWRMAQRTGMDLDDPVVRWPKELRRAHDTAMQTQKLLEAECRSQDFAAMSLRLEGLCWEHDGICIRPARSERELIEEGKTLHHCVGGYGPQHIEGRCIFFIRHTRRPERSWYTLNVDMKSKHILQNHGYKNEQVDGKTLKIPQRVQEFVALWKEQVLDPYRMPTEAEARRRLEKRTKKKGADRNGTAAGAA